MSFVHIFWYMIYFSQKKYTRVLLYTFHYMEKNDFKKNILKAGSFMCYCCLLKLLMFVDVYICICVTVHCTNQPYSVIFLFIMLFVDCMYVNICITVPI